MLLQERARIEIYLPDLPDRRYRRFRAALEHELTYTFGGCTEIRGIKGMYKTVAGKNVRESIRLIYADSLFPIAGNEQALADYAHQLREAAHAALDEESVLVTVVRVAHAE